MAHIIYRSLGPNGDALRGQGRSNFLADRNAVAQAVLTRLRLLAAEWFEDLNDGTPLFQQILGQQAQTQAIATVLTQRILGTPYVTGVTNLVTALEEKTGALQFSCLAQTRFGAVQISSGT